MKLKYRKILLYIKWYALDIFTLQQSLFLSFNKKLSVLSWIYLSLAASFFKRGHFNWIIQDGIAVFYSIKKLIFYIKIDEKI